MRKLLVCLSVLGLVTLFVGRALAGDTWVGNWKLNEAKSKVGSNVIRAQTLKFEATADGVKLKAPRPAA